MKKLILLPLILLFSFQSFTQQVSSLSVFSRHQGRDSQWLMFKDNDQALYEIIAHEAFHLLDQRKNAISQLKSERNWKNYQKELKGQFFQSPDQFKKTPLNGRITGTLVRDGFTVEKIIFESHPGFYVTAALFLPKERQEPAPAVIYCSGHTKLGFRSETYQRVIINLVNKGFIVFAFDPISQGERLQYVDPETGESKIGGPTTEHSYAGVQTLLTGISISDYFIRDGVRAIDYLETRDEVDAKRIGITGRSGGGTQSALIAAYDDRIYAAAPECYITNFKRLLQSIGPQDAEQNPYRAIKKEFDHPDYLHLRAPKPALIITTTHDFFSQQGARETYDEVKKSYAAFGKPENIQLTEDFGIHESTKGNRETLYAFFQKHLNLPGDNTDRDIEPFTIEELWATKTGQIGTSMEGKTVFNLNQEYFSEENLSENQMKKKIKELSGIDFSRKLTTPVYTGKIKKESYDVKKYFLENDREDFALPVYVMHQPKSAIENVVVWLHPAGKAALLEEALLPELMKQNYAVIAADLPGIGELEDPDFRGDGFVRSVPFNYLFGANLAGKSIPGIQAEALDLVMQFIQRDFASKEVAAITDGASNQVLLHYTALKNPFTKILLRHPLESNQSLIKTEHYDPHLAYYVVPGSVPYYDFRDLVSLLPEGSVQVVNPMNAKGEKTGTDKSSAEMMKFLNQR